MNGGKIVLFVVLGFIVMLAGSFAMRGCKWAGEAVQVITEEVAPRELKRKYEMFKELYATLGSKRSSVEILENDVKTIEEGYTEDGKTIPRRKWRREDVREWSQSRKELNGIKLSYNLVAKEYNKQMSLWYTKFMNMGKLPDGSQFDLPREVAVYLTR